VGSAPEHAVEALLARGYKRADAGESLQTREAIRYSGVGDAVSAAAQGAARTAIPGYDAAAQAIVGALPGGDSERTRQYLQGLKQHQAGATMAGEIGGYFTGAGALAGRGGAALARAAAGGAPGLLRGAAGTALGGAFEGAAAGLGEGVSELALDDAQLTGERMAGVLGSSMLRGAGYGAGAAAGLHLGGKLLGAGGSGVKRALERTAKEGEPGLLLRGMAEAQSRMTGANKDDILKLWTGKNAQRAVMDAPKVRQSATASLTDDVSGLLDDSRSLLDLHVGGRREATFSHLVPEYKGAQTAQANALLGQASDLVGALGASERSILPASLRKSMERRIRTLGQDAAEGAARGDGAAVNQSLNALKQDFGRAVNRSKAATKAGGVDAPLWRETQNQLEDFYHTLQRSLEDTATWGGAAEAQRAINAPTTQALSYKRFRDLFTTQHGKDKFDVLFVGDSRKLDSFVGSLGDGSSKLDREVLQKVAQGEAGRAKALLDHAGASMTPAEREAATRQLARAERIAKTLDDAEGTLSLAKAFDEVKARDGVSSAAVVGGIIGGAPGAALGGLIGAASAPGKTIAQLAALQNLTGRMGDRVGAGLRGTFALAKPGGSAFSVPRLVQPLDNREASKDEAYRIRAESARLAQTTPGQVRAEVERQLLEQLPRAPSTARAAADAAARQHAALSKVAPNPTSKYLLGPAPTPSATEIDRMRRAQKAVADYPSILDDVRNGTVSPETVDILKSVYPAEYANIKQRAMDDIAEASAKGKMLPYEQRRALGILLDEPVEPLQDPELVRDIQASFAPTEPQGRRAPSATPGQRRERVNSYRTGSQETAADEG
jgi:hypothetical protein